MASNQLRSFYNNNSDLTVCVLNNRTVMNMIFWQKLIKRPFI